MAEARGRDEWARTSALMALIANVNRDPKRGRAFRPADFDPYHVEKPTAIRVDESNIGMMKAAFMGPASALGLRRAGRKGVNPCGS